MTDAETQALIDLSHSPLGLMIWMFLNLRRRYDIIDDYPGAL